MHPYTFPPLRTAVASLIACATLAACSSNGASTEALPSIQATPAMATRSVVSRKLVGGVVNVVQTFSAPTAAVNQLNPPVYLIVTFTNEATVPEVVGVVDPLPTVTGGVLSIVPAATVQNDCNAASKVTTSPATTLSITGVTLQPNGGSCAIQVQVVASAVGTYDDNVAPVTITVNPNAGRFVWSGQQLTVKAPGDHLYVPFPTTGVVDVYNVGSTVNTPPLCQLTSPLFPKPSIVTVNSQGPTQTGDIFVYDSSGNVVTMISPAVMSACSGGATVNIPAASSYTMASFSLGYTASAMTIDSRGYLAVASVTQGGLFYNTDSTKGPVGKLLAQAQPAPSGGFTQVTADLGYTDVTGLPHAGGTIYFGDTADHYWKYATPTGTPVTNPYACNVNIYYLTLSENLPLQQTYPWSMVFGGGYLFVSSSMYYSKGNESSAGPLMGYYGDVWAEPATSDCDEDGAGDQVAFTESLGSFGYSTSNDTLTYTVPNSLAYDYNSQFNSQAGGTLAVGTTYAGGSFQPKSGSTTLFWPAIRTWQAALVGGSSNTLQAPTGMYGYDGMPEAQWTSASNNSGWTTGYAYGW